MHLFVICDTVLTAFVSVIKQCVKAHGPIVLSNPARGLLRSLCVSVRLSFHVCVCVCLLPTWLKKYLTNQLHFAWRASLGPRDEVIRF